VAKVLRVADHHPTSIWETPLPSDTTLDADQAQLRLLREKSPAQRLALAVRLSSEVIRASKRAISRAHPELAERQVGNLFKGVSTSLS